MATLVISPNGIETRRAQFISKYESIKSIIIKNSKAHFWAFAINRKKFISMTKIESMRWRK
jgi:hypothetical protein